MLAILWLGPDPQKMVVSKWFDWMPFCLSNAAISRAGIMGKTNSFDQNQGAFETTHWTVVMAAAGANSTHAMEAFGKLYGDYWYPLYAYARRRGASPHESQDLVQGFFVRLLEKDLLAGMSRDGGKFRSFLLRSFDNFVINVRERANAIKRGGGVPALPLHFDDAESRYKLDPTDNVTPESLFELHWTMTLLERVLQVLRQEYCDSGKEAMFADLQCYLQGDKSGRPYAEIALSRGMTENAVKTAVYRLRLRYGELLRREISRTVSSASEVQEELRHLISVIGR